MPILLSGWVIWNAGSVTSPHFIPKEIYPPALEVVEATETVYATKLEAQAAINKNGGPSSYHAAGAAGKGGTLSPASAIGDVGATAQDTAPGIASIGSLADKLGQGNTWLRAGEFAIGGVFLYVALKAMFPGTVAAAAAPAKKAAKAVTFV
jgi:hypothetical protein